MYSFFTLFVISKKCKFNRTYNLIQTKEQTFLSIYTFKKDYLNLDK